MRRDSLGAAGFRQPANPTYEELFFYGPMGAINASEDLILETRQWREQLFASRHAPRAASRLGTRTALREHRGSRDARLHGRRPARPQPAARGHGRHRRSSLLATVLDEPRQHPARHALRRANAAARPAAAASPAQAARGADLLHRSDQRPGRRARPGADAAGPDGVATSGSAPRPSRIDSTSSISIWERSLTTRSSTCQTGARSSPASPTATRRR